VKKNNKMEQFVKDIFINALEKMIPMHSYMEIKVMDINFGKVKLLFPFKPEFVGDIRINRLHGGFIASAVDASGGAAAMTHMKTEKDRVSTLDIRIDFLKPGQAKDIIAEGTIINRGTNVIFTEMKIYHPETPEIIIAKGSGVYEIRTYENENNN
jgi:uncharacterized protein (TIGR00369 family)